MVVIPKLSDDLEIDIVHSIINATGRDVIITYVISRGVCPICGGTNPFCPTCSGSPTVDITGTTTFTGRVKWAGSDRKRYEPVGQIVEGDCLVTLPTTTSGDVLSTGLLLEKAVNVTVDSRVCVIDKWYFRGNPINRVYLVLNEDDKIGVQRVG